MEHAITILAESTNQSYKTTKTALEKLEKKALLPHKKKRQSPNTQVPNRKPPKLNIGMRVNSKEPNRHLKYFANYFL